MSESPRNWNRRGKNGIILFSQNVNLFKDFIYLFLERKEGREISMCGCLLRVPYRAPGLQPRHRPWQGIEPATLRFSGQHSIHTSQGPKCEFLFIYLFMYLFIFNGGDHTHVQSYLPRPLFSMKVSFSYHALHCFFPFGHLVLLITVPRSLDHYLQLFPRKVQNANLV